MISKSTDPPTAENSYLYALRLLTARDYSIARMKVKLAARGTCEADIEAVTQRLKSEGWMDDRRYAGRFAEAALANGKYYGVRLRQEMRRRGFGAQLVDEVLDSLQEGFDEESEVAVMLKRRYPDFCFSSATDRDIRRVAGYLQRRGFGLSAIMKALKAQEQD